MPWMGPVTGPPGVAANAVAVLNVVPEPTRGELPLVSNRCRYHQFFKRNEYHHHPKVHRHACMLTGPHITQPAAVHVLHVHGVFHVLDTVKPMVRAVSAEHIGYGAPQSLNNGPSYTFCTHLN